VQIVVAVAALLVMTAAGSRWATLWRRAPPVIAVLPFGNLSVEPESEYFTDGLTDEIIRNLSVIDGLEVRSRTSSFAFKNKPRNTREVGEALQATLVLEGSVLRAGDRVRINAQLVRVADDVPLWSGRFDRELKDVFAIQDEISRSIVNELRLNLGRGQRRYETSAQTYELFLKARALQASRAENARLAVDLFRQVVTADPAYAPAHAALATTYAYLAYLFPIEGGYAVPLDEAEPVMRQAAFKALELDPLLADAQAAMGHVHAFDRDWAKAEASFRRALALNRSLTTTHTDFVLSTLLPEGKLNEAMQLLETALLADPLSLDVRRILAHVQTNAGLYDRAIENCDRVLAVDPGFPFVKGWRVRALLHKGRVREAIAWMETQGGGAEGYLGYAYAVSGRLGEAEALAAKNENHPQRQAMIYAGLGDTDRAFAALERLVAVNPMRAAAYLTRPELDRLRGDARMVALRGKLGLP
jgi:TolB-like protein/Tfp pilus assembly protein PilF